MTARIVPTDLRVPLAQLDGAGGVAAWMQAGSDKIPLHGFLRLQINEVGEGRATATAQLIEDLQGQVAPLHGAVVFAMAAFARGAATWGAWDPATTLVIAQEAHLRLLGQPRSSPITAAGRLVHRGRRTLSTEAVVTDGGEYQLARCSTTYLIIEEYGGNPT